MNSPVDIAVIGAGAAGIAAAVAAARAGCKTILLDQRPGAGGTGGFSGLTTLCGLYDSAGEFLNDGFAREFAAALAERRSPDRLEAKAAFAPADPEIGVPLQMGRVWVLQYRPEKFRAVAAGFFAATPKLQTGWHTPLTAVTVKAGRIAQLNGRRVGAVIDCTGTAAVAQAVGAECLATDETTQAPAVVFPLCNVTCEFSTPTAVARALLPVARAGFPPLNLQANLDPQTLTVKFTGRVDEVKALLAFLRANVPGFENCSPPHAELVATPRAGRMILGQYLLTGADVLAGRRFPDAVARCAWPIEQWGRNGVPRFRYLPPGTHYEIPARSLRAANVENLFMAGKTISADVDAIASARVIGCCLATGAAAGRLAADYLNSSRTP